MKRVHSPRSRATCAAFVLSLAGCAGTLHVTPSPYAFPAATCTLPGHVEYTCAPDYVPAVLADAPDSALVYTFTFRVEYGSSAVEPFVQLVNPLDLVGFPTGAHDVRVVARVDARTPQGDSRSYAAVAAAGATGTIFSEGATLTELRRRALFGARDSLSRQLCADAPALAALARAANPEAPRPP